MLTDWLLDLLLPESCTLCDRAGRNGFCDTCRASLPLLRDPCEVCGLPTAHHRSCRGVRGIERIVAPYAFDGAIARAIHLLKYDRRRSVARALGLAFADAAGSRIGAIDVLVPVPLHPARLRQRTFDQADEIARVIGARLSIRVGAGHVERVRDTASQTTLAAAERRRNMAGAFAVVREFTAGTRVGIVDDVVTTGATTGALAAGIAAAGAAGISLIAIARAVPSASPVDDAPGLKPRRPRRL